jgi:hypothetical protein
MIRKPRTSSLLAFLDVDLSHYNSGESSSDESFKIENHKEDSDFASSSDSDSEGGESDSEDDKSSDDEEPESEKISRAQAAQHKQFHRKSFSSRRKPMHLRQRNSSPDQSAVHVWAIEATTPTKLSSAIAAKSPCTKAATV